MYFGAALLMLQSLHGAWIPKFFQYSGFNLLLAFGSSVSLFLISPAAAGSGIPDVKAYLNGVEHPAFRNFFTVETFVAKVIGSALAVASSLVMGKEGPMLHAGSILAVILGKSAPSAPAPSQALQWYACFVHDACCHLDAMSLQPCKRTTGIQLGND